MNSFVSPLPEHSNQRIQTVKLTLEIPIILINVYLPASSLPQQEYDDSLNLLASVIANFQSEAAIFVAGDCNRSLFRNNPGDLKFQKFCKTVGLQPATNTKQVPTYHGYNGSTSQIDYILMHKESCMMLGIKEDDLRIISQVCKDDDPTILSTHDAIYFELNISVSPTTSGISVVQSTPVTNKILLWNSADLELYQQSLENILTQNFEFWNSPECISTLARLIPQAFIQSAEIAVPSKQKKEINFKTVKSEEWRKAEISAKKATKQWKAQGKPRNEENLYFIAKKGTRLNLRKAVKYDSSEKNTNENNLMMEANFRDPKLFSKLVNKKRNKNQGYTAMINVNDQEYRGDAQVLSVFFYIP